MATTTSKKNPLAAKPGQKGIDPRGPRFGAIITFILLGIDIVLAILTVIFAWGAFAGIQRHPYGLIFKTFIRPRLGAPEELEDPKPPTFAQLIGFLVTAVGVVLALVGVPYGLVGAAAFAFIAAFLNGVFGYCLGCQIYVLLARAGIVGRSKASA
jgi:hypothetical protein